MLRFDCDYNNGAYPQVLKGLCEINEEYFDTYGYDSYSEKAVNMIKKLCGKEDLYAYFLSGGTICNLTLIRAALYPYEGVVASSDAHIAVHETGAIEATGHKVLTIKSSGKANAGKVISKELEDFLNEDINDPNSEHVVKPGMLYISQPTELGTLYTEKELYELSEICKKHGIYMYCDGARLACAIGHFGENMFKILADTCDAFYIGGNKCGALFGEALVVINKDIQKHMKHVIKQSGALMAKGYLIGKQFEILLDGEYEKIGKKVNEHAKMLRDKLLEKNIEFLSVSDTNQQIFIIDEDKAKNLSKYVKFTEFKNYPDGKKAIRFVTSYKTSEDDVNRLIELIDEYL